MSFLLILVAINRRFTHFFVTSSSFFGGEQKHSHFPKLQSENVKILTSPSIFADVGTKITIMENILHAFSLDRTEPHKSKTKAKYISISNILHLLSTPVSITRVVTIWDSLVVT